MSDTADFAAQVNKVCKKVRRTVGWIKRSFITRKHAFLKFMWQTYCQPMIDYAGQLWSPTASPLMTNIEALQCSFTMMFPGLRESSNYWERLSHLRMNSQIRRAERYKCIYTWKILEGKAPNCGLTWASTPTSGRLCSVPCSPSSAPAGVQTLRNRSFQVTGPRVFNSLPASIRDLSGVSPDTFKLKLDQYLTNLPDQPSIGGMYPAPCNQLTGQPSNSIVDWARHLGLVNRRPTTTSSQCASSTVDSI
jgi:hypothetical protein